MQGKCVWCGNPQANDIGRRDIAGKPTCLECYASGAEPAAAVKINGVVRTCTAIAGLQWSDDAAISYTPEGTDIEGGERWLSTTEARALAAWLDAAADAAERRAWIQAERSAAYARGKVE